MEYRVDRVGDHTWLICTSEEYSDFLVAMTQPDFGEGACPMKAARYREFAELQVDAFRTAHHIPLLKRENPLLSHLFDIYLVETGSMSVLEEGFDEFAVSLWSLSLKHESARHN